MPLSDQNLNYLWTDFLSEMPFFNSSQRLSILVIHIDDSDSEGVHICRMVFYTFLGHSLNHSWLLECIKKDEWHFKRFWYPVKHFSLDFRFDPHHFIDCGVLLHNFQQSDSVNLRQTDKNSDAIFIALSNSVFENSQLHSLPVERKHKKEQRIVSISF